MALLLSAMHTLVSPRACANSKAWRMIRSTPFQVLISSWIATSSSVPGLNRPPMPTYRPSVFSRNTTNSHVGRAAALQRAEPLVEQHDRAVVDVEIELEARAEQDVAGVAVVGHAGVAQRADEDRVERAAAWS